jgi:ATP-binding cassette, subfamily B, bacterial
MRILYKYLKPNKWLVVLTLVLAAINTIFSLFDPIILGKIIKLANDTDAARLAGKEPAWNSFLQSTLWLLLLSVCTAMVSRIAKNFQDYFANVVIQKFGANVFTQGLKHAMSLPYQEFEDQRSGETLSILQKVRVDVEKFVNYFLNALFSIVVGIGFVFVYAAIYINWRVPIVYVVGIILLTWVTNVLSKKIKIIQKNIVGRTTALAGSTTESLRNIETVKSLGLVEQEVERLNKNTFRILGLELEKVKRIRSISFLQGTLVNTLRQVILFLLMWLIFKGEMRADQLVTMQIFSFFIFGPLQEIGNILLSYREAEASITNYDNLMRKKPEPEPEKPLKIGTIEKLEYESVGFQHASADHPALQQINFTVQKGETIAFVGPSGSGKTTLVKLLVGLYRPMQGKILYNGVDGEQMNYEELRKQISFVTQDTQLFAGSIRENLQFVMPNASDEDMLAAMKKASCHTLLNRAQNGLDTVIGEGGMKISGGEKQRLSIARALLRQPHLLIFDEATSALDSLTELEITDTIKSISKDKEQITVLIAHRLSTIMHSNKIFVLEKGEIIETGNHEELLAEKGLYYAMWRQQIGERKAAYTD